MNSIVETALHRYARDTLAKPDYVLYSSSARINPHLTSPTYFHHPTSLFKRFGSFLFGGTGATWGHQPAMALFQDTNVGMCWAFPGAQGGLGFVFGKWCLPMYQWDISTKKFQRISVLHPVNGRCMHSPTPLPTNK
jgi:hypothetical protein